MAIRKGNGDVLGATGLDRVAVGTIQTFCPDDQTALGIPRSFNSPATGT